MERDKDMSETDPTNDSRIEENDDDPVLNNPQRIANRRAKERQAMLAARLLLREEAEEQQMREQEASARGLNNRPQEQETENYNSNIERALRPGEKPLSEGHHFETIKNQFLQDVEVEWANDREEAEKHIRGILGEIEIAQEDVDQQIQIDYKNALDVLEVLSRKKSDKDWTKHPPEKMSDEQVEEQQKWAKKMRLEIKARLKLHGAFLKYEGGGSIKDVKEAMIGLYGGWLNIVFELKEKIPGTNESFNPFVEALQYYEDHGHEFARHNSEEDRPKFQARVQEHLVDYSVRRQLNLLDIPRKNFTAEQEENYQRISKDKKVAEYQWASNMAERLFRATGRATMYDFLVVNKDKANERIVSWDYDGPEKADWASGRDGCDYPMSKIYRFRENMKAEEGLMRGQIQLLNGADILAGDFWTRTVGMSSIKTIGTSEPLFTYRNRDENGQKERLQILRKRLKEQYLFEGLNEVEAQEKVDDAVEKAKKSNPIGLNMEQEKEAIIEARKAELIKNGRNEAEAIAEANAYYEEIYQADILGDRSGDENFGEVVGRINFRLMDRTVKDDELVSGIDFIKMGATPTSLWVSRMLDGPETAKGPLSESREAYLLNPNFDTLGKLLGVFDYSKANTWKVKEQLIKNYIKFAQSDAIEETGREKLSDEAIINGVNKLAGINDPNAPQFIQPQERAKILMDFMHIKISDEEKEKMDVQAEEQAEAQIVSENPGLEKDSPEFKEKFKNRKLKIKNKLVRKMIDSRIEHKINTMFATSFVGEFALGALKEGFKEALKP